MQIHNIKPIHRHKKTKRIGRGGKRGTYSGKGLKGQSSRAGRKFQPMIREMIKRYPKLKGYRQSPFEKSEITVNLSDISKRFKAGEIVSPETLFKKRIIRRIKGKIPKVKILGKGDIINKLVFENCNFSKGAKKKTEKIEKTGKKIKGKK